MKRKTRLNDGFIKVLLVLAVFLLPVVVTPTMAEGLLWAQSAGGSSADRGLGIAVDAASNIFVTGGIFDTATFGAGGPNETTLRSDGLYDIFVAKYAPAGSLLWVEQAGGISNETGQGIAVDTAGDIVLTGCFRYKATFAEDAPNEITLVADGSEEVCDIFLAKYTPGGSLLWAKRAGGFDSDVGYGIAVSVAREILVTGIFKDRAVFGEGESNETTLVADGEGEYDIFVAKYAPSGSLLWAKRAGGPYSDAARGIAVNAAGEILVTGNFGYLAIFGEDEPNETKLVSDTGEMFVAKYAPGGSLLWVKQSLSNGIGASGRGVAVDGAGEISVTGSVGAYWSFNGTTILGAGEPNETTLITEDSRGEMFVAKYTPSGTLLWAKQSYTYNYGDTNASEIAVDAAQNILVTGYHQGTVIFGEGEKNETLLTSEDATNWNTYITKYTPNGSLLGATQAGGTYNISTSVAVDAAAQVLVTGRFLGNVTFSDGDTNETTLVSSDEGEDIFIAKYGSSIVPSSRGTMQSKGR